MNAGVPCMILRGGSSKGAYFVADDLPAGAALRSDLLLRIMGSPADRQVDGIGGAHPRTHTFIPHRCHDAIGVLGAVSVATAALLADAPASEVIDGGDAGVVTLEHPTGFFDAAISVTVDDRGELIIERAGIIRTARKLLDGLVYPRGC